MSASKKLAACMRSCAKFRQGADDYRAKPAMNAERQPEHNSNSLRVLALAGGVGGAKLTSGLAEVLGERLTVLVNTADDFEHLGLHISPDLDTVMYTLAGIANPQTGWGLTEETWTFMSQIERLGGPTWFRLGDRDLATHVTRTERLAGGDSLTAVMTDLCRRLGVRSRLLPMSDDPVRTLVHSEAGTLPFQDYFVRLKCGPKVTGFAFEGAAQAKYNSSLDDLLTAKERLAVVICPSNPYVSIDPILALPGLREWLRATDAPIVAVSPIVGGAAIKGPAAKMMHELGCGSSVLSIARHYSGLADALVIDEADRDSAVQIAQLGMRVRVAHTVMRTQANRVTLARECLTLAEKLGCKT
jgi:LPPG:FO 2-phospho-L-lactate transferase